MVSNTYDTVLSYVLVRWKIPHPHSKWRVTHRVRFWQSERNIGTNTPGTKCHMLETFPGKKRKHFSFLNVWMLALRLFYTSSSLNCALSSLKRSLFKQADFETLLIIIICFSLQTLNDRHLLLLLFSAVRQLTIVRYGFHRKFTTRTPRPLW